MFVAGFSVLNAVLLGGLGYLAYKTSKREGGIVVAARSASRKCYLLLQRLTGSTLTPLQAGVLVMGVLALIWYYWIRPGNSFGWRLVRRPLLGWERGARHSLRPEVSTVCTVDQQLTK